MFYTPDITDFALQILRGGNTYIARKLKVRELVSRSRGRGQGPGFDSQPSSNDTLTRHPPDPHHRHR